MRCARFAPQAAEWRRRPTTRVLGLDPERARGHTSRARATPNILAMTPGDVELHPETLAVVSGREPSPGAPFSVPPTFSSVYRPGGSIGYGRWDNPSWRAFETALGAMEGGEAVAYSCGQAATAALLSTLVEGATVVCAAGAYLGTRALLADRRDNGRLRVREVEVSDTEAVVQALPGADLLWLESPTNPLLEIADLPTVLAAAADFGAMTVVDNTFATPLLQQPLDWGASAVVHSATKYLGGHADLLLGAVVTRDTPLREALVHHRTMEGAIPGVMEAFLALRGLRTLPVRLERMQATAALLAARLVEHPAVRRVRYPGLRADPGHLRARRQMRGFGAVVSFDVTTADAADQLVEELRLIIPATSLGGVETTIERRARWSGEEAVPPGLLRLSIGLEHPDDLWQDLAEGLDRCSP